MLMLRNLVTSLFEHEQIQTTLPKARDTARLAEKIITLGKRGDRPAYHRAASFLLKPSLLPKLFGPFAKRYAERPGGYTRIHKFGNRPGDNAPHAVLELVDNPRDLRMEITSRAVGWELLKENLKAQNPSAIIDRGVQGTQELIEKERSLAPKTPGLLRERTRWNLQKVLKFRDPSAVADVGKKASSYIDLLVAKPLVMRALLDSEKEKREKLPLNKRKLLVPNRPRVAQALPGETRSPLQLVRGSLGRPKDTQTNRRGIGSDPTPRLLNEKTVFK
jgi:ribosomal protein L17